MESRTLKMTAENPVMVHNVFLGMQGIPSVARRTMPINDDADVERISVLVSGIGVVVDISKRSRCIYLYT